MLDAHFLHIYFCQSVLTLQRGLAAIADSVCRFLCFSMPVFFISTCFELQKLSVWLGNIIALYSAEFEVLKFLC